MGWFAVEQIKEVMLGKKNSRNKFVFDRRMQDYNEFTKRFTFQNYLNERKGG